MKTIAKKRILLVDDSSTQRMKFLSVLSRHGCYVEAVSDGVEAMHFLENTSVFPDLVLSDIFMPNMDGFELCTNIKEKYPNLPFIILTSDKDEQNLRKAFNCGAVDFLGKPFNELEVIVRVFNVLKRVKAEKLLVDKALELTSKQAELEEQVENYKAAKTELHKKDSLFKDVFYNANDALLIIFKNEFIDCNDTAVKLLNAKSKEDLLAVHPSQLSPEKQPDGKFSNKKADEMMKIAYKKGFHRFEWMHKKNTGEIFPVEVSLTVIELNNELMLHTHWKDLSKQKKNEEEIRKVEIFLKNKVAESDQIFNISKDWKRVIDFDYNVLRANDSMAKMLGKEKKELIGKKCYDIFPGSQCNTAECPVRKVLEKGVGFETETEKQCLDGVHSCILSVAPFRDEAGKKIGILESFLDITERVEAEIELKESEVKYRSLIETTKTGYLILNSKGQVVDANKEYLSITGYTDLSEIKGRSVLEWVAEYDLGGSIKCLEECMKSGFINNFGFDCVNRQGKIVHVEINARVIETEGEIRVIALCRDISERKKLLESVKLSEQRFKLALDGAGLGLWDWNISTGEIVYDELWCEMLGYMKDEVESTVSYTWKKLLHPDDRPRVAKILNKHFENESNEFSVEFRMRTKERTWKWILGKGKICQRNHDDVPTRMVGIHLDINRQKILEKALEESEGQLRALLDNSPDMIELIGLNNRIRWANKTALDICPDAIGRVCIFTDSDSPCKECPTQKVLKGGSFEKNVVLTHQVMGAFGKQFWETVGVPLKDNSGTVTGVLKISRNVTDRLRMEHEIKKANKDLKKLVYADPLTGLVNRKPFMDLLEKKICRSKRENTKIALLFTDLDGFKNINDIYGHETGDEILIKAAGMIKKSIRESDFCGRIGGDEFVICLDDIKSLAGAVSVVKTINETFQNRVKVKDLLLDLGISIGIAVYPENGKSAGELLKNSDLAMYKAKKQRVNSFYVFNEALKEELFFEQELSFALEKNEFRVTFQPIVDINQKPYCVETLARWENPELGTVMPMDFIPVLEQNRLIVDVGEWIFREACRKLKAFNDKNNSNVLVSVNISQYQVEDEFFVEKIEKAIKETKVNPRNILIEITEKIQIKDTEKIRKAIEKLKEIEIGCIGLDDFGSGYSSFSNLIRFSIDVVKIDKFFTDRLTNEKYYNITKALVALIKKYDLKIIAEGVETKEQFELLKRIGCDYFQGYYFSKPQSSISKAFNIKNK